MSRPACLIPARGGSKRIPGKNMKDFLGKPILQRVIQNALESELFSAVYVSSEDIDILSKAISWGAKAIVRPVELSSDETWLEPVVEHAIGVHPEAGEWCMILATGVFATPLHLRMSYSVWDGYDLMVSMKRYGWYKVKDAGQFYWINPLDFMAKWKRGIEILDQDIVQYRLRWAVDINTDDDWRAAEILYSSIYAGEV